MASFASSALSFADVAFGDSRRGWRRVRHRGDHRGDILRVKDAIRTRVVVRTRVDAPVGVPQPWLPRAVVDEKNLPDVAWDERATDDGTFKTRTPNTSAQPTRSGHDRRDPGNIEGF
jgi:hypothetical protein